MFVGEAPGAEEDQQGKAFVGPAGQLLGVVNARDGLRALLAAGNHEEALLRNYVMGIGYQ